MAIEIRFRVFKDAVSASTHFAGFLAAIVGLVVLVVLTAHDAVLVTSMAVYGASLVLLFLASSVYHFFDLGPRGNRWLKRVDHAAIFLLIAGTYVPALVMTLDGAWRIAMLSVVGGLALAGIVFKLAWISAPRWLGVALYLGLGWVVVIPAHLIFPRLSPESTAWLVAGGLAYTAGALVYALKRPDPWPPWLGFHEIWHLFVLAGATAHYFFALSLVGAPRVPF